MDKALVCGTADCRCKSCHGHCPIFAENHKKTHSEEKAKEKVAEVQVRDMPARIGAEERAGRHASKVLPSEMLGTGPGELG